MASSVAAFLSSVFLPEPLHNDAPAAPAPEPEYKPDAVEEANHSEPSVDNAEVEPQEEDTEPQDVGACTDSKPWYGLIERFNETACSWYTR